MLDLRILLIDCYVLFTRSCAPPAAVGRNAEYFFAIHAISQHRLQACLPPREGRHFYCLCFGPRRRLCRNLTLALFLGCSYGLVREWSMVFRMQLKRIWISRARSIGGALPRDDFRFLDSFSSGRRDSGWQFNRLFSARKLARILARKTARAILYWEHFLLL